MEKHVHERRHLPLFKMTRRSPWCWCCAGAVGPKFAMDPAPSLHVAGAKATGIRPSEGGPCLWSFNDDDVVVQVGINGRAHQGVRFASRGLRRLRNQVEARNGVEELR